MSQSNRKDDFILYRIILEGLEGVKVGEGLEVGEHLKLCTSNPSSTSNPYQRALEKASTRL